ncbi:MAG: TetR family transcriptional regulator [Burkholderiaceae bacterium]
MSSARQAARTNEERSRQTRAALVQAARELFVRNGYADTGTPQIVQSAGVTRGALYHHFEDKAELLLAVLAGEAAAVAAEIEATAAGKDDPVQALLAGARAYFEAMAAPGRAQLLLQIGPSVLGPEALERLHAPNGTASLRAGLAELGAGKGSKQARVLDALAGILGAGFDHAALAVAQGASATPYLSAFRELFEGLAGLTKMSRRAT